MQTTFLTPTHQQPKTKYFLGNVKSNIPNDPQVFNIEALLCGNGSREHGISLMRDTYYASDRDDGGIESFYEIDRNNVMLTTRGARRGGNWETRTITARSRHRPIEPVPRVNIPKAKRNNVEYKRRVLRSAALGWLGRNCGIALIVGGPGSRGDISGAKHHFVSQLGPVFEQQDDSNCIAAAIINAIDVVRGRQEASVFREDFYDSNLHILKMRDTSRLLHEFGTKTEMRKIPKAVRAVYDENPFRFLANVREGVYVVHLKQARIVDHTIVVDASRQLIIDSEEEYPMRLSEELLRRCGGDVATSLTVEDLRIVVDQASSNPSNP